MVFWVIVNKKTLRKVPETMSVHSGVEYPPRSLKLERATAGVSGATGPILLSLHSLLHTYHILRLPAVPFSHSKSTRTHTVHQKLFLHSFFATFGAHVTPKLAPRQAPGLAKEPPGPHKASPGHLKTD